MLFATKNDGATVGWHIGEFFEASPHHTVEIQADCDELDFILANCKNIKHTGRLVNRWYGDDAKFIAGFLLMYGQKKA